MGKLSWKDWIGVIVVALVVAAVAFFGLLQITQWQQESATLQNIVQLLNYNIATGRLVQIPPPTVTPAPVAPVAAAPVPAPTPPPEAVKK